MPIGVTEAKLAQWGTARVDRGLIAGQIESTLRDRGDEFRYQQLFNFHYEDGPKMLTTGGVISTDEDQETLKSCGFAEFEYVRGSAEPFEITQPLE